MDRIEELTDLEMELWLEELTSEIAILIQDGDFEVRMAADRADPPPDWCR